MFVAFLSYVKLYPLHNALSHEEAGTLLAQMHLRNTAFPVLRVHSLFCLMRLYPSEMMLEPFLV